MTEGRFSQEHLLIPQLWRVLDPDRRRRGRQCRSRLWDVTKPPQAAIRDILDMIGGVLVDGANTVPVSNTETAELSGHMSFANPLASADGLSPACMLIDQDKVDAKITRGRKQHPYFFRGAGGYTRMKLVEEHSTERILGKAHHLRKDIIESVHRFVMWAIHGPPGDELMLMNPVCMHDCHVANCVSPYHIRHGSHAENLRDRVPRAQ